MKALDRKVLRDLARMRGQVLAIVAVMSCGLAIFVGASSTHDSLRRAREQYYAESRFGDVFAAVVRAPLSVVDRLREIQGVASVQARIEEAVTVSVPGFGEPVTGRMISLPSTPDRMDLDRVTVRRGRWPVRGQKREVLVSESFATAHRLEPGDRLRAVLHGNEEEIQVVGVALAPDYIVEMPSGGFLPDSLRFGVFWMAREDLEVAFELQGAFNQVSFRLGRGAVEAEVIRQADRLLQPYGGIGAYGRKDQMSDRFLSDELAQLRVMSVFPPTLFLGVAAYLLNVSLGRLLSLQRSQVAVLKSFGYSTWDVGCHYGKLAAVLVAGGAAGGIALGTWMGSFMTDMYREFYRFPMELYHVDPRLLVLAAGITAVAAGVGVTGSVRAAVSLPPAVAMQPEPPAVYRRSVTDRFRLMARLSPPVRMWVRELERRPGRAVLGVSGIGLAASGLIMGNFGKDSISHIMDVQFGLSQRYDAAVSFHRPVPLRAVHDLAALPGVLAVEPVRAVPVRFRHGPKHKQTVIEGIAEPGRFVRLKQLLDVDRVRVDAPENGLLVSLALASGLGIQVGDTVRVEILERERPVRNVTVTGIVEDYEGLSAYLRLEALHRLLREGPSLTSAYLTIDPGAESQVYERLRQSPEVAGVALKRASMRSFLETFGENMLRMRMFNVMFATTIAIGVIYNSMRVVLSERSRELATMRVIGFRHAEVGAVLQGHLAVLVLGAIPCGLGLGTLFCWLVARALTTDLYRVPFILSRETYGVAVLVVLGAAGACAWILDRAIRKLDLIGVLKARE
jgi:putative ABC transport system permease protein